MKIISVLIFIPKQVHHFCFHLLLKVRRIIIPTIFLHCHYRRAEKIKKTKIMKKTMMMVYKMFMMMRKKNIMTRRKNINEKIRKFLILKKIRRTVRLLNATHHRLLQEHFHQNHLNTKITVTKTKMFLLFHQRNDEEDLIINSKISSTTTTFPKKNNNIGVPSPSICGKSQNLFITFSLNTNDSFILHVFPQTPHNFVKPSRCGQCFANFRFGIKRSPPSSSSFSFSSSRRPVP